MKTPSISAPQLCPRFHRASELIGRRWTGAILFVLVGAPRCRFATLRAAVPGITDRMLSERLQELEAEEVVARTVVPDTPVRVEYSLTRKGQSLAKAIHAIAAWAEEWIDPPPPSTPPASPKARSQRPPRRPRRTAA
jgi:DNA-binding HxlR family transcriptional regulator